jgi:hypothetical protein
MLAYPGQPMDRGLRLFVGRGHPHALPQSIFERHGPVMLFEEVPEGLSASSCRERI